jgi:hypothetical protein
MKPMLGNAATLLLLQYCKGFDQSIVRQQIGKYVPIQAPRNDRGSYVFYVVRAGAI